MNIAREQALPYVSVQLDDSLNIVEITPDCKVDPDAVLIGWQCGFEPMFVAVKSYLPNVTLDQEEAVDIAVGYLDEIGWFGEVCKPGSSGFPIEPDYIIGGKI